MAVSCRWTLPPLKRPEDLQPAVAKALDGLEFEMSTAFDELVVSLPAAVAVEACRRLKENGSLLFDYLRCLSGVETPEGFEVVYHVYSVPQRHKLTLKARLAKEAPKIGSATGVWKGADWHEREAAEMFGIVFEGHPHLIRLLLDDGVEGFPLLKSFKLDDIPADVAATGDMNGS